MKSEDEILSITLGLTRLLRDNDEAGWSRVIDTIRNRYIFSDNKAEAAREFIAIMMGGMGSFNDLILHRDGKPLSVESNELRDLRSKLYDACLDVISRTNEDRVITISGNMIKLLRDNNETRWSSSIELIRNHYIFSDVKAEAAREFMALMMEGKGSFSDFVEENDKLAVLKDQLFNACQDIITNDAKGH